MTALTSDAALTRIKARAQIPSTDPRLADTDLHAILDDLIVTELGVSVYDADDGRWIATASDVSVTSGVSEYRIPSRAWAGGVDSIHLIDSNGNEIPVDYVDRHEIPTWSNAAWSSTLNSSRPRYTILGDVLRLMPTPTDSAYSLRVRYVRRPSALVAVSSAALISSVASSALTATYPSGAAWTSIDVIEGTYSGASLEDDVSVTLSGGSTITRGSGSYATTGAGTIAAGDYACNAGTSCVLQVPDVAVAFLIERAAGEVADVLGDAEMARSRLLLAEQKRKKMEGALAERTQQRPKAIPYGSPLRAWGQRPRGLWGVR